MIFVLMWVMWLLSIAIFFTHGSVWLLVGGLLTAIGMTVAVLIKYQENLYLREELRNKLIKVRNDIINLFLKFLSANQIHFKVDDKDRGTVRDIASNLFKNLSWLWWSGGQLYPPGVLSLPTTDQEVVAQLNSLYDELRTLVDEYNNTFLELRKKELSIIWYFVYSTKGFEYLNKVSFPKAAERMANEAIDNF